MGGHVIASFSVVAVDSFACLELGGIEAERIRIRYYKSLAPSFSSFFFSPSSFIVYPLPCYSSFCAYIFSPLFSPLCEGEKFREIDLGRHLVLGSGYVE